MRRVKHSVYTLLSAIALFASLALSSGSASAASDYDNVVVLGQPTVTCGNFEVDLSTSYLPIIQSKNNSSFNAYLGDALDAERGLVLTQSYSSGSINGLALFASTNPTVSTASFHSGYYPGGYLAGQNLVRATISCDRSTGVNVFNVDFNTTQATREIAMNTGGGGYRPVFINMPVTYPTGYEGVTVPSEYTAPPSTYVAMGDSFSSGEGNPPFEYGTNTGSNACHRSPQAYPRLLQSDPNLGLGSTAFVACSGAKTSNVLNGGSADGAWGETPQIDALSADTKVVTITIGGNNVGFTDYAIACAETLCGPGTFDYDYIMGAINDSDFYDSLVATYESILTHAPNAHVYVSGYPYLAAEGSDVCGAIDLTGVWAVQNQLNAVIEDAVGDVASTIPTTRVHYVDPNHTGSPFSGKYLCNGGTSDFNGLYWPSNTEYSFHPNADGHQDFKSVFENAMS